MSNRAGPPPVERQEAQPTTLALVVKGMDDRADQFSALVGRDHWERWKTVALHALAQNNKVLRECSSVSILEAVRESAAMNLSPTGLLGEGWIIPYKGVAQFQPGWRGLIKLLRNSGQIAVVDTQVVYLADEFRLVQGTDPQITHVPLLFGEKDPETGEYLSDRGDYRGAYAYVRFNNGQIVVEWMPWPDIMKVRARSRAQSDDTPWNTFPEEMARKTVLRRLIKRLPLETMPHVQRAAELDAEADIIEGEAVEITSGARATAAAYALGRGASDEENGAQRGSDAVSAAAADSEACGALTPEDYEPGSCSLTIGHEGLHRFEGSSWA